MEPELPDFCSLRTADLLGLALDVLQHPGPESGSQDLVQAGAGAGRVISQHWREAGPSMGKGGAPGAGLGPDHSGTSAPTDIVTTQELDLELRRLPLDSEPQPGSEPPPQPFPAVSHVSATLRGTHGGSGHSAVARVEPDTLDTTALDEELRALPLETQVPDAFVGEGAEIYTVEGGPPLLQSFGTGSQDLAHGDMYIDSQALDDELRALPVESIVDDAMQPPPPPSVGTPNQRAEAQVAMAALALSSHVGAPTALRLQLRDPPRLQQQQQQQQQQHVPVARPVPSSWDAFDTFGGVGSFDDDLEDYLAAQAADAQQMATQAPPSQQQQQQQLGLPDLDDLDDLLYDMEYGGRPPTARPSGSTAVARAPRSTSSQCGVMSIGGNGAGVVHRHSGVATDGTAAAMRVRGRSQENVQQGGGRQAKRARTELRGRPTMDELFGSDNHEEEDDAGVTVIEAAPVAHRAAEALRWPARGRLEGEVGKMEEEEAQPRRPSYFPPQRLASCIKGGTALPVTAASGERVYCRMAETTDDAERGAMTRAVAQKLGDGDAAHGGVRRRGRGCLLAMPLADMLRELEDRQLQEAVAASEREEERRKRQQQQQQRRQEEQVAAEEMPFMDMAEDDVEAAAAVAAGVAAGPRERGTRRTSGAAARHPLAVGMGLEEESMLWVDKYAPRHFMSLLSDERTNRQVALWVKDWDECVFGKGGGTAAAGARAGKGGATGRKVDSRPQHKVLLIGGPPGLGKTTLAHVVARHCGYHPFEINASDDRTAATLLTRIQDAVQMTAVLGGNRPNCVIVDEVDGATGGSETGGAVAALLKLVRAGEVGTAGGGGKAAGGDDDDNASDGENEGADGGKKAPGTKRRASGRKSGQQQRPLCRPIICICNDLYTPVLRPLRDVARVFHFSPPASERLTARLAHICQAERLEVDPTALRLLVERTDRDVRACLNTLQFLARRGTSLSASAARAPDSRRRTIEVKDIESLNIASKDTTQSAMDMWTLLLSTGATGRKRNGGGGNLGGCAASSQLSELCNRLQDFGDYDLVLSGLHENLPRVRFMDINLNRTAEVEEAVGTVDILLRCCRRTGDFSCLKFVPPLLAKVRALAAQPERPRQLTWPRLGTEAMRRASAATQLVRSWASGRGTDPRVMASHGITVMTLELAPALRTLVSQPTIRAVAPHMMSAEEQAALRGTAGIMLHYGLRYCFESPTPPGLLPLHLPEVVAPVSNNAIILGLTADVQKDIAAAAAGGVNAGRGFQRQPPQPFGGRGPGSGFRGDRSGRFQQNSYGQVRGPGGDTGFRGPPGAAGPGAAAVGNGAQPQVASTMAARSPDASTRHMPLVPAIDTLHLFTAFTGAVSGGPRVTIPHVVRQMISQQTEMEAIRRAEATRMAAAASGGLNQPKAESVQIESSGGAKEVVARGHGPLQPMAPPQVPPPQRQMAGRMPPPSEGKKGATAAGAGTKRKGTWMDAFKQQASAKVRVGVGVGVSEVAAARQVDQAAEAPAGAPGTSSGVVSPRKSAEQGRLPFPVLYRFNEGYTNAVKRTLLMRELM